MKVLLVALCVVLISSCSSTPKKKNEISVKNIKSKDFKAVRAIPYRVEDDVFSKVKSKTSAISNSESLQRIYLYDGDIELSGDLGEIAKLCYKKKFEKAFTMVKGLNKKYVKNPIFWNQVGTCYLLKGERRKALLFYNKALSHKSNYAPALNNLGVMYMTEGDYSRSLVAFTKARDAKSFSRTPRYNLANLKLNFGLYDSAIKELKVLYRISKTDIDVNNMLGVAYMMSNNPKEARRYLIRIPAKYKKDPRFGLNHALCESLLKNKEDARSLFKRVRKKKLGSWSQYYEEVARVVLK